MENQAQKFTFFDWSIDRWLLDQNLNKIKPEQAAEIISDCPEYVQESAADDPEDVSVLINEDGDALVSVGPVWTAWLESGPDLDLVQPGAPETAPEAEPVHFEPFVAPEFDLARPEGARGRGEGRTPWSRRSRRNSNLS